MDRKTYEQRESLIIREYNERSAALTRKVRENPNDWGVFFECADDMRALHDEFDQRLRRLDAEATRHKWKWWKR